MKDQGIVRVVDALASQQRIILWLSCKHTVTISMMAAHMMARHEVEAMRVGEKWPCPHCADPTPEQIREAKTPTQLWKEAGEP